VHLSDEGSSIDDLLASNPSIPGAIVLVRTRNAEVLGQAGFADIEHRRPMSAGHAFRIASNTKTFVAATTMSLLADRRMALDDPIDGILPDEVHDLLSRRYDLTAITVRMLLQHTSGIASHDTGSHDGTSSPFLAAAKASPQRQWTAIEQIEFSLDRFEPTFPPGHAMAYSDTGYVVLGQVVEFVSGEPLHRAVRTRCQFETLGLRHTWWDRVEEPVERTARARVYIGEEDWEAVDCSIDLYGGGGLVSTVADLATWWRALFHGEVIARPALEPMLTPLAPSPESHGDAGLGLFRRKLAGRSWWSHSGYWGSIVLYDPDTDLIIVAFRNQAQVRTAAIEPTLRRFLDAATATAKRT
jgi:D-alanyl-D-alanine carboxypeptidase